MEVRRPCLKTAVEWGFQVQPLRTAQMFRLLFPSLACKLELPSQLGIPNGMEVMPYGNSHQFYNARPNLCVR